jgi:hypothetical protein
MITIGFLIVSQVLLYFLRYQFIEIFTTDPDIQEMLLESYLAL